MAGSAMAQKYEEKIAGESPRQLLLIDKGWKFHRGAIDIPQPVSHHETYVRVKAGAAPGPSGFSYDDSSWRTVEVPHDYVVEGTFDSKEGVSHGFLDRPEAWYRRQFTLPTADRGKTIWLYFDGVFGQSQVWVNGQELRKNDNGYIGFRVNISDVAHYGDRPNTIAVKVDPREPQGWWYEGGGIYRHVWLTVADPIHVAPFGVYVHPEKGAHDTWDTLVDTTIESEEKEETSVTVVTSILDPSGKVVGKETSMDIVPPGETFTFEQKIPVKSPKLWDIDSPNLYGVRTEVFVDGKKVDAYGDRFGYRTLKFDADKGFFLNDKPVKFKGVCMHQDHAGVGVAVPDSMQDFRIKVLKDFGTNAYRCSHNPPAKEVLEACDEQGMLVLNENRFYNSGEDYLRQLEEQVKRDRNHPSVMMWSVFNEEPWQGDERGRKMVERMKHSILRHDKTRPVTGAMNGGYNKDGAFGAVDVLGINYALPQHDHAHKLYPDKMVFSSEAVSHSASRGEWKTDQGKHIFNNYDNHWVGWGSSVREAWKHVDTRPWDAGVFIWTGFDYRGEPTPFAWPAISSYFGIVDTCGFPKDSYYLLKALWTDEPMAYVFPHWNLGSEMVGKTVKVGTYTNGDEVELILNGKSLGKRKHDRYAQTFWDVVYEPGVLELVAYKDGKKYAEHSVETTGKPEVLELTLMSSSGGTASGDALQVGVCAKDAKGRTVPDAKVKVTFDVDGGRLLGVGNGDPVCHEPDASSERSLYNGYAAAVVKPEGGRVKVRAASPGLKPAVLNVDVRKPGSGHVSCPEVAASTVLSDWRMSEITDKPQDPNRTIADNDMNTWQPVTVGSGPQSPWAQKQGWATYRATFTMPGGGSLWDLQFNNLAGRVAVYVNGRKVAERKSADKATFTAPVDLPAGTPVTVSVQMEGVSPQSGMTGAVRLVPVKGERQVPWDASGWNKAGKGTVQEGRAWSEIKLDKPVKVRQIALKIDSMHKSGTFAHVAEIDVVDAAGKPLDKKGWKVSFASSQEVKKEQAPASRAIDGNTDTFWHTPYEGQVPNPPHIIAIDLGKAENVSAVRVFGRDAQKVGGAKDVEVLVR
ncbi:glycoside hydrolase catalytic domain [Akkermansia glycaniphila]|uniref:Glycoside hydrolase catalytic domain n=2 Tax=Akkermansia glycaniphila TaxID=1679444 RepID=A0A1H6ML23_9BACT|nr:glycoside hydrolase catalytic domain [Akkermansia glycaniphila]